MLKFRNHLLSCSFGIPGMVVGFVIAYFEIKEYVAAQLATRGCVDSTSINSPYFTYGLAGYLASAIVGGILFNRRQQRKSDEGA